ncbi:DNA damage-inducible protein D [Candidatus Woesebacteria bacterium]|nr:DNA damage-inducible protein D [Candidatus Woesebacteria bacterium]
MTPQLSLVTLSPSFESIKKIDENGVEYWDGRELMPILGYKKWEKAEFVIDRAAQACINSGESTQNHFHREVKMVQIGSNTLREIQNWKLDRYACYLIAQNGDPYKKEIAQAQTYFAIQTRRQEIFEQMTQDQKRLYIRNEVTIENKKLFSTAKRAGVTNFGTFNDAGYRGLYNMPLADIEKKKNIRKGELLDRAGTTELAANLFRITQTDEKIRVENIHGQERSSTTHFEVGRKVRKAIKDIGGTMPEKLPPETNIKKLKIRKKKLL